MNTKTMDGLIGARMNMEMVNVPMRVFKEARLKGDTATMERAMGYVGEFSEKAWEYEAKADEGMKEEAKEEREKAKERAKEELAEKIEKRKEEQKAEAEELQEKIREKGQESAAEKGEGSEAKAEGNRLNGAGDRKTAETGGPGDWKTAEADGPDRKPEPVRELPQTGAPDKKPVLYSSTGELKAAPEQNLGTNISVSL